MSEKFEKGLSATGNEMKTGIPKEAVTAAQIKEIMEREGLRPATMREMLEAFGYDQQEVDMLVENFEKAKDKEE